MTVNTVVIVGINFKVRDKMCRFLKQFVNNKALDIIVGVIPERQ
jgi:hypothetical protein